MVHPPLTRVASSPTFPSASHHGMSPPAGLWPAHSQPLFSLANVISMAMTMAQSLVPPTATMGGTVAQSLVPPPASVAGYQLQYQPAPLEASYPAATAYHRPQREDLAPSFQPTWPQPGSAPSPLPGFASSPPPGSAPLPPSDSTPSLLPLQQVGGTGSLLDTQVPAHSPTEGLGWLRPLSLVSTVSSLTLSPNCRWF